MANIKPFDLMLTAAALMALFLLLPADKDVSVAHKTNKALLAVPANSETPKTRHQQPINLSALRHA